MDERRVIIQAPDGREASVTLDDYRAKEIDAAGHTYQQLHWRLVRWETGEPYQPPSADPAAHGLASDAPDRPARRRDGGQ